MRRVLGGLETTGRALGWIGTVTSAIASLAALTIALNNHELARDNLRYQRINASLQFGTNLFRDLDGANERYGDACMDWIATFDPTGIAAWVASGSLDGADSDGPQAARCLAGSDAHALPGARADFVSRQVFNRLNTYFLPLQALDSGVFDRAIICDDVVGIVDSPATRTFFATVARGTRIEQDYAPLAAFLATSPCMTARRRESRHGSFGAIG